MLLTVVLEKNLESPLDCKEIQRVHAKGNQSWIFIGRTDAEAEAPILWPPDEKSWLIWEDPDAGQDWRQEEKETKENEMVGWHDLLDGHEFEQAPGVGDGQGRLACCSQWDHKESHMTQWLIWIKSISVISYLYCLKFSNFQFSIRYWKFLINKIHHLFLFTEIFLRIHDKYERQLQATGKCSVRCQIKRLSFQLCHKLRTWNQIFKNLDILVVLMKYFVEINISKLIVQ